MKTALLIIDIQQGFDNPFWGQRNNPDAEVNAERLLHHWREKQWPVVHIQHASTHPESPLHPDQPGFAYKQAVSPAPGEQQFQKHVNSAFIGTSLEDYLNQQNITHLVIVGLTTDHCVSTTTRMAGNLGFEVTLVGDATATFDREYEGHYYSAEDIHQHHCLSLDGEFCTLTTTDQIIQSSS